MKTMLGYHFMADKNGAPVLRDGRPCPPVGVTLTHDRKLRLCSAGYHASRRAIDALGFAPGPWVARVRLSGTIETDTDKAVATERTITAGPIDATAVLREFAAACAYHALERYGDKLTADQMDTCLWAADIAAAIAAGAEIPDEERASASAAARTAALAAAGASASAAASAAAWAATSASACAATSASAWASASAAARTAALAAAGASASAAARTAALAAENKTLERMLSEAGL